MKKFKLGVGPISAEIVELCLEYSANHNYPIMIIASRNQVDHDNGYSMTTMELSKLTKNNSHYDSNRMLLCRDHCGPYFSDLDNGLSLCEAIARCKQTISSDIDSGFSLIHIDVSKVSNNLKKNVAEELFEFAIKKNNNIMFEFGTEDNTGNTSETLHLLNKQIRWVEKYRNNIKYIVSQTGSLTKQKQIGTFDLQYNQSISELIHSYGYLFKEHNADYLKREQVRLRSLVNVDAINIAPQLGAICSEVLYDLSNNSLLLQKFIDTVLKSEYWKRWCTNDVDSIKTKFIVSAHYLFGHNDCKNLVNSLNLNTYKEELKSRIYYALDEYRLGYEL
jgi:tagatose-1,6-bisphosphate aldolase non-catalytic subunit AgaZ/GatZ